MMDYEKLHNETLRNLQEMVSKGKITEVVAKGICADFVAESEDEKIRNTIFDCLYKCCDSGVISREQREKCIAWLEKQGEQNLIKIPKFKRGDTIEFNGFRRNRYIIKDVYGLSHYTSTDGGRLDMSYTDANFELVEQKPVLNPKFKVGDKVKQGYLTFTVDSVGEDSYKLQAYSEDGDKGCTEFLTIGHEDGYELVEQKPQRMVSAEAKEAMYDKPALNEEDKSWFKELELMALSFSNDDSYRKKFFDWLKSLKERVQPKLKQEWNEEDETHIDTITSLLEDRKKEQSDWGVEVLNEEIACLKSIRTQNRWKPSDEQMNALKETCDEHWEPDGVDPLYTLYQDLRKLRE